MAEHANRTIIPRHSPDPTLAGAAPGSGEIAPPAEATISATTVPVSAVAARAARLAITSGVAFALLLLSLHLLEPEFDPTWRFISEYALGRFGWLMHLAFFLLAASLLGTGVAIFPHVRTVAGYLGLVILGVGALGLILAGVFRTDPIMAGQGGATFSGTMHVLGASLDYSPLAFTLLSFVLARAGAWRPVRTWLFLTAGITLLAMLALILQLPRDGQFGPGVLAGLFGRVLLVSYLGPIVTIGLHILRLRRETNHS